MRRKSLITLVAVAALLSGAVSAATEPQPRQIITHELLYSMKRVSNPVPSPDGRWVVFTLVEPSYDEKDQVSDLWIVPADGSAKPRRLTSSKGGESDVDWSADSRRIAFSAKREGDEVSQIYILDVTGGGEAARVTRVSTGAGKPQWRPDGKAILFTSSVYPGAADDAANRRIAKERKERKYNARVYETFPIRRWDRWLDDTHPHVFVQSLEPAGEPEDLLAGTRLIAEPGFSGVGAESGGEDLRATWTPDGASIVFLASTDRNAAAYAQTSAQLYEIPAAGGEPKMLAGSDGSYGSPRFRPDGKALYFTWEPVNEHVYNGRRIAMISWPERRGRTLVLADGELSPSTFSFAPDSRSIWFTAEDGGRVKLYTMPAEGGTPKLAVDAQVGVYGSLSIPEQARAPVLVATWGSSVNPSEVVRIDPVKKQNEFLTSFNVDLARTIDWLPPVHFWFTSSRGKKIHNMLIVPPRFDASKKYPVIALIHGGANNMWTDSISLRWDYHLLASRGYVVLLTNYSGSTGFGEAFAQSIEGDPLKGPGDEINEAVDEAIRRYPYIDPARQAAGGASYGGHLANWLEASTTRYRCLFSHAGLVNLESQWATSDGIYHREMAMGGPVWEQGAVWREQNPIRYAAQFRTPILVTVGEKDFRVPMNNAIENWSVLQRMKVPSKLIVFPDENHWILKPEDNRFFWTELQEWLARWLGPEAPASSPAK